MWPLLVIPSDFVARLLPRLEGRVLPVHSTFERSLNLSVGPTVLLTVTSPSLGRSPFGLVAETELGAILPAIRRAGRVTYRTGTWQVDENPVLTLSPRPPYPTGLTAHTPVPGVSAAAFHQLLLSLAEPEQGGLAEVLPHWPCGQPLSQMAVPPPANLSPGVARAWEPMMVFDHAHTPDLVEAAPRLLGLGLGLTPSGDDFLLGFVAGRLAQGRRDEVRALGRALSHRVFDATSLVSASYLRHAFRGRFGSQLRRLIAVLHSRSADPQELRTAVLGAIQVGSTSGWDTLVGLLTALYRFQHEQDPVLPR